MAQLCHVVDSFRMKEPPSLHAQTYCSGTPEKCMNGKAHTVLPIPLLSRGCCLNLKIDRRTGGRSKCHEPDRLTKWSRLNVEMRLLCGNHARSSSSRGAHSSEIGLKTHMHTGVQRCRHEFSHSNAAHAVHQRKQICNSPGHEKRTWRQAGKEASPSP